MIANSQKALSHLTLGTLDGSKTAALNFGVVKKETLLTQIQMAVGGPLVARQNEMEVSSEFKSWVQRSVQMRDYHSMALTVRTSAQRCNTTAFISSLSHVCYAHMFQTYASVFSGSVLKLLPDFAPAIGEITRIEHNNALTGQCVPALLFCM